MERYPEQNKEDPCVCGDTIDLVSKDAFSCSRLRDYLTVDEEAVLQKIRALWKESRKIKARLKEIDSTVKCSRNDKDRSEATGFHILNGNDSEQTTREWRQHTRRLEELRAERKCLDRAWEEANRIKLVLLGHIEEMPS
jgi:hypothetical protein